MNSSSTSADQLFSLGKLHADRCDFTLAIQSLREASKLFQLSGENSQYLKAQNLLMRIFAEREQFDEILLISNNLFALAQSGVIEMDSKTHYTLALSASYKSEHQLALEHLQKALTLAIDSDNKEDICYAISGRVAAYIKQGLFDEALQEINKLEIFFQVLDISDLKISMIMSKANIFAEQKKYGQALDLLFQTFEYVREGKSLLLQINLMISLGWVYSTAGDKNKARLYLQLASQSCDPKNLSYRAKYIQSELVKLGGMTGASYDLVFDLENRFVFEQSLGKIDFKNQFLLLDLLRLFAENQGQFYSKESLVAHVWKQSYNPAEHDNKIYVTIKRLRKLIEPNSDRPRYICRDQAGYFMNRMIKIFIEPKEL